MTAALNRATCFGAQPKQRILMGIHVLQSDNKDRLLMCAKRARKLIRRDFEDAFAKVDLLLSPTVNTFAPIFGGFGNTVTEQFTDEFSVPANHAGVPAISVPLYQERNGWQSAQVIAKEFDEGRMFLLARRHRRMALPTRGSMNSLIVAIGLEVHVELKMTSKLFCKCPVVNDPANPNSASCHVCQGQPGVLPALNPDVVP